jgi:hypothetical protein
LFVSANHRFVDQKNFHNIFNSEKRFNLQQVKIVRTSLEKFDSLGFAK